MKINFSLIQADLIWENTHANLEMFDNLLKQVPFETEIVILPEMFSTGFTMNVQNLEKPVGHKAFHWLREKADEWQKIIVASILYEENGKYYNRMFWMRPSGSFEYYDKRHLFHQGGEDKVMTAGQKKTIIHYKDVKFLLQICYDLRFPVWSKNNFDQKTKTYDYDAIIYIANWPQSRKQAYMNLLKARAIENQSLILWVNRVGMDAKNNMHSGDTQIVDELGNVLTIAAERTENILSFSFDFNQINDYRNQFKVGLDWDKFKILK